MDNPPVSRGVIGFLESFETTSQRWLLRSLAAVYVNSNCEGTTYNRLAAE